MFKPRLWPRPEGQQAGYYSDPCLQEECLETCSCSDMGRDEHYHQGEIGEFFDISYGHFAAVRTDNRSECAEKHEENEECRCA